MVCASQAHRPHASIEVDFGPRVHAWEQDSRIDDTGAHVDACRSNIERLLNKGLLSAFFITLICCATMTTGKAIWGESHPDDWYLAFTERVESVKTLLRRVNQ